MRIKLLLFFFMLSVTFMVKAQDEDTDDEDTTEEISKEEACSVGCEDGWCWGSDKTKASEQWTLLDDNVGMKNFKGGEAPLEWLLANAPCLNKALYINGEKVLKALEKEAENDSTELIYQDKLMDLYGMRIKYFGKEKFVKDKVGIVAYVYYTNRGGKTYSSKRPHWTKMFNIYDDILNLNGKESKYYNVRYFMQSAEKMYKLDKDTTAFMNAYDRCEDIIEYALPKAKEKYKAKWEDTDNKVQSIFESNMDIKCDYVKSRWIPQLKKDANDMKLAKKSIRYMIKDKCTDDPDFDFLVELVYKIEPSAAMAKLLAQKYLAKGDYETAEKFYREMIKMAGGEDGSEDGSSEEDPGMQAEGYMAIAGIKAKQNKYSEARTLYLKAAAADSNQAARAYTNIGELYMRTASSCLPPAEDRDPVLNRGAYLAAYDMFAKAGNNSRMSAAKGAFPSKTDIFTWAKKGYVEGQSIKVYGWIGGSAILRAR